MLIQNDAMLIQNDAMLIQNDAMLIHAYINAWILHEINATAMNA